MLRVCFMHEFEYRNTGCKYQTQTQVRNSTSNWGIQDPLTCNTNTCLRWLCVCVCVHVHNTPLPLSKHQAKQICSNDSKSDNLWLDWVIFMFVMWTKYS